MRLSIGIVGLPNVGKSTLFKALTNQEVNIANYPFATIDPNVGVVTVPDERLETLTAMSKSKKTIPAVIEFYDIAGLVKGANKGEGLGNQFLSHIRETQAIVIVLRVFEDPNIIHVESTVDPLRDLEIIKMELILKDLETIEKVFAKLEAETKSGDKQAQKNLEDVAVIKKSLTAGNLLSSSPDLMFLIRANKRISELNLLTVKRELYLLNGKASDVFPELINAIKAAGGDYLVMDLSQGGEIGELIRKAYSILDLISFFTAGEDESRAWTIERGTKAPQAAGVIHTDFEKNFIRAEVVAYDKFVSSGGWAQAKQKGFLRVEGKEYVVLDGDIMVIRHG